jgi:hypothetical protein
MISDDVGAGAAIKNLIRDHADAFWHSSVAPYSIRANLNLTSNPGAI